MNDIKIFASNEKETLIQTRRINNQDYRNRRKNVPFLSYRVRKEATEGREPSNQESIGILWVNGNYKYPGLLEAGTFKWMEIKEKVRK